MYLAPSGWLLAHKHRSIPDVVSNLTRAVQKLTEKVEKLVGFGIVYPLIIDC